MQIMSQISQRCRLPPNHAFYVLIKSKVAKPLPGEHPGTSPLWPLSYCCISSVYSRVHLSDCVRMGSVALLHVLSLFLIIQYGVTADGMSRYS